ncbi:MAG: helicase, partial [Pseudonocardiales bacterium]|nr:helicase [Pseudonocardiales bacterium]
KGVFEQFAEEDGGLRLELVVQPAINYALVHNRVPPVRHLSVTNKTDLPLADLEVRLELLGPEGPLTTPWVRAVSTPVSRESTVGWEDFAEFTPDQTRLLGNNEAFPADYRLTVIRPGQPDVRLVAPSSVLAHNEWFNSLALYDSLAAFVQPNTRAVEAVLRSAAQILLDRTESGSLQGYQAGPERAAQIAGAVYEALRQLGIHYQGLPASFENTGQKVRTTAAVLDGLLGNCLDLSVTYAACLEAAGLHPLIWLTSTHAFAGFLVEEERLGAAAVTEANLLISMVESGKAVPVELTRIGPGAQTADFTTAVQAGLGHFRTSSHELQGVVDVHLAHRSGIRPLPSADTLEKPTESMSGSTTPVVGSIDLPVGVARTKLREHAEAGDGAPEQADGSPLRIQQWKKSLLDLSLRNPLLNLPKRGRGLDLHVPSGALALLDDLIHEGKQIQVIPQDAISHVHELAGTRRAQDLDPEMLTKELRTDLRIYGAVTEQKYVSTMRAIQRDARTMEQETGSNYLYLTIGTLVHAKTTGTEAHAPLFLLPVRIEGGTGRKPYVMVVDGPEIATPNYCLIEWLRVKHDVRIPELENPAHDEAGIDIPKTLAAINARLVDNRLNYRIDESASLRLLQFSTFQMWRDLTDHWPTFLENPVVRHLVESASATFDDPAGADHNPHVDEAELHLPIPADGSQMQAIVMAERGQSFVLEGPPGTGKSQTITNLIARAISTGRSVLFVAEKQAALDVVKRRLNQVGLSPFALDLHGRKQSIKAIREQLREALEQHERGGEGTWTAVETGYRTRLAPLANYPELVHATNAAGMSAWSAYEGALAYGDGPTAPVPVSYLATSADQRREVEVALRAFPAAARSARLRPTHPWSLSGRRTVDGLLAGAVEQVAAELEESRLMVAESDQLVGLLRDLPNPNAVAGLVAGARLAT